MQSSRRGFRSFNEIITYKIVKAKTLKLGTDKPLGLRIALFVMKGGDSHEQARGSDVATCSMLTYLSGDNYR